MSSSTSGGSSKDNTAKATVADQIAQSVQSTANLLHLMQQSSPSQNQLLKLPKNLLEKTPTILNTGQVLQQMPQVISSLDAYMENGLQNGQHLKGAVQLLKSMENSQLSSLSQVQLSQKANEHAHQT